MKLIIFLAAIAAVIANPSLDDLPDQNREIIEGWLNTLPPRHSHFLRHDYNASRELIQVGWDLSATINHCANHARPGDVACRNGMKPNPEVADDLSALAAVAETYFDPNRQVVYSIPKFNADTIAGFNVTSYNPNYNAPGTGTTIPFDVFYVGDKTLLQHYPRTVPLAYNSIPPYGPVNNSFFTNPNVGFHIPRDSLPIQDGVMLRPAIWAIGSCQYGLDYYNSTVHLASKGFAVIVPRYIPGICTDFNSSDFNYNFATDYVEIIRAIVKQTYHASQAGSGHPVFENHIDWTHPLLVCHSEGCVQFMMLLAGYAPNGVDQFEILSNADSLFVPRDAPWDNMPPEALRNMDAKLHQTVSSQRGWGEMAAERGMGDNQDQYFNDFFYIQGAEHESMAVSEKREGNAAIASGNCANSPYWVKPCNAIYYIHANSSLDGSVVSPDGMAVLTNKYDIIYSQCWQGGKNPIYCLYLYTPFLQLQLADIANVRRPGKPGVQYVVPRVPEFSHDICPHPTPGVCVWSADNRTDGVANRPAQQWIQGWSYPSYGASFEVEEAYFVGTLIDQRSFPGLGLTLYYDDLPFPVWPIEHGFYVIGNLDYRAKQYSLRVINS